MVRIAEIEAGSIAEELSLEIGSRIVRINGERVRDGIDLTFLLADEHLTLETLSPAGQTVLYELEREPGEPVGIVAEPDTIRECANECVFCFIDGNPESARPALRLRDDDFRLSFTYGSYVTLTNLGPKGLARLIEQRISPLYVSVHATEPAVRERLLVNRRAGLIMDQLRRLSAGGLEIHTQVVLCPGWNDGSHLDRTIEDLWALGSQIASLSVVPVGLTRYNLDRPVRLLNPGEGAVAIERCDPFRRLGPPILKIPGDPVIPKIPESVLIIQHRLESTLKMACNMAHISYTLHRHPAPLCVDCVQFGCKGPMSCDQRTPAEKDKLEAGRRFRLSK